MTFPRLGKGPPGAVLRPGASGREAAADLTRGHGVSRCDGSEMGGLAVQPTLTPDGRYYAYSYARTLSDLFLVEGLR